MLPYILNLYKEIGETPLERLDRFRLENPEYKDAILSYLGRLDPMAEGVLLVAVGEENKNRDQYLGLPKEYETEILFGVETDTHDLLGKIISNSQEDSIKNDSKNISLDDFFGKIEKLLPTYIGKRPQTYPAYSSRTVDGKPLHAWSREGRLDEITIPQNEAEIFSIDILESQKIDVQTILKYAEENIKKVKGDFRQEEIITGWRAWAEKNHTNSANSKQEFLIIRLLISCVSGTYIRSLAHNLGREVATGALAYSIKRTSVGEFTISSSRR